ncbi:hypothetical protein SHXM_01933 [Streptomyces hygroscopicus]|nr:hypothetical protein SHXM_01933 [Streptomyces hygroscopicus]
MQLVTAKVVTDEAPLYDLLKNLTMHMLKQLMRRMRHSLNSRYLSMYPRRRLPSTGTLT